VPFDATLPDEPDWLYIDIETRSNVNLITKGVYVYAEDPSTAIILLSWAINDGPITTWLIMQGEPMPAELIAAILSPRTRFVAHNAGFERVLLTVVARSYLPAAVWNALRIHERWTCTAARAALMGLPRSLDGAAKALHVAVSKDMDGKALMLLMCRPLTHSPTGFTWLEDVVSQRRLADYCEIDVAVERELAKDLPVQSAFEHAVWCTTERMNDRGIAVDGPLLYKLMLFSSDAEISVNQQLSEKTGNLVTTVNKVKALERWCIDQGLTHADGEKGVGRWIITKWLDDESLPKLTREVLVLRKEGGKTSTKKFTAIAGRMNMDDRLRGSLLYCGAASTSRFSSRGAQLQNLPRGTTVKNMEQAILDVMDDIGIEAIRRHGPPLVVASEMARPVFVAKYGHLLARGDYSQIEARVLAFIADEHWKVQAFRNYDKIIGYRDDHGKQVPIRLGPDLYTLAATSIFNCSPEEVIPDWRQAGKVSELACGYQGGYKAILSMARLYNVKLTDERAEEIKVSWRTANPKIVQFWYDLENAAVTCMQRPMGEKTYVGGRLGFWFKRNSRALALNIPGGGALIYWYPKLEMVTTPWGTQKLAVTFMAEDSQKHIWVKHVGYGGLFCENICQKMARDIMADALVRMDAADMAPVLTVHDEAICQISLERCPTAKEAADLVERLMLIHPQCYDGLPIAAEASAARRYLKMSG
jgi:DNA polymerase bacteriophage-type